MMNKDLKRLIRDVEAQGFVVTRTKRGHYTVTFEGRWVTTFPGTGSDWRGLKNALAALRRAGFRKPP